MSFKLSMRSASKLALAVSAALAVGAAGSAEAQQSADSDAVSVQDTITVTARKKAEDAQDVPITIDAFSEEEIDRFQIESLEDLEGLITGAEFIADTGNPFDTEIIMRGGGIGRQLNVDGGTGLYSNGINVQGGNFGGRSLWNIDTFDVQRYEVLKGPQGALYGRNAMGGAINTISKRPSTDYMNLRIRGGVHANDGYSIAGFGNLPVVQDKFAVRFAGQYYDQSEGFYYNPVRDEFLDAKETTNLRAAALWQLSDNWDALFQYDFFDTTQQGDLTYSDATADPFVRPTDDPNIGTKGEESFYAALRGDLGFGELNFIVNNRTRDASRTFDLDEGVASPVFDPDVQKACFSIMVMGSTVVSGEQRCTNTAEGLFERTSVEARLNGTHDQLDWIVGADWFEYADEFDFAAEGRQTNSFNTDLDNDTSSWSIFGGAEYAFTDRLSIGAEARYTTEDKDLFYLVVATDPSVAGTVVNENITSNSYEYSTWAVYGSYELRDDALAYARVGTGFRAGGFNRDSRDLVNPDDGSIAVIPDDFTEERALSYEAGLKTAWLDGALLLNGAAFFVEYQDFISNANNGLRGVNRIAYVTNLGDAELYGAELESRYRVRDFIGNTSLNLSANVAFTEGEIINAVDPVAEGRKLSRIPQWSYGARAQLDTPLSDKLTGFGSLSYSGQNGGFQTFTNSRDLQEPQLFNAQIGLRSDTWTLAVSARNLFDEDEPLLNEDGASEFLARNPRTWSVVFTKRFGEQRPGRGANRRGGAG